MRITNLDSEELFTNSGEVLMTVYVRFDVQSSRGNVAGILARPWAARFGVRIP